MKLSIKQKLRLSIGLLVASYLIIYVVSSVLTNKMHIGSKSLLNANEAGIALLKISKSVKNVEVMIANTLHDVNSYDAAVIDMEITNLIETEKRISSIPIMFKAVREKQEAIAHASKLMSTTLEHGNTIIRNHKDQGSFQRWLTNEYANASKVMEKEGFEQPLYPIDLININKPNKHHCYNRCYINSSMD